MIGAKLIIKAVQITTQRQMHTFVLALGPTHLFYKIMKKYPILLILQIM